MKYFLLLALLVFAVGCTHVEINYPKGGYPYPKQVASWDEKQYHYPVKDIINKQDSFENAYQYIIYEAYNEPNLSLHPQEEGIFRFKLTANMDDDIIIRLTPHYIIVKQGSPVGIFHDEDKLTEVENRHFSLLNSHFPIDTLGKDSTKRFLKAAVRSFPRLLEPTYYKELFEKSLTDDRVVHKWGKHLYSYHETYLPISVDEYKKIVTEINASGFWKLPYEQIQETPDIMDDEMFSLEASTRDQYQMTTRWFDFDDTSKFTMACQHLIDLAGLHSELRLVYPYPGTISR